MKLTVFDFAFGALPVVHSPCLERRGIMRQIADIGEGHRGPTLIRVRAGA